MDTAKIQHIHTLIHKIKQKNEALKQNYKNKTILSVNKWYDSECETERARH